jgi:Protein of unknwon function (DUF3310)
MDGTDPRRSRVRVAVPPGAVDMVNTPPHYHQENPMYEPAKVIRAWGLPWALGDAVKYISRAGRKGDKAEDLRKAIWYITDEIEAIEPPVNLGVRRLDPVRAGTPKEDDHGHNSAISAIRAAFRDLHVAVLDDQAEQFLRTLVGEGWVLIREEDV